MLNALIAPLRLLWDAICQSPPLVYAHHHGFIGPLVGNIVVASIAGVVTVFCFVIAGRMLVRPGERDPKHPKYRILESDR